jgi:hypothetical protein
MAYIKRGFSWHVVFLKAKNKEDEAESAFTTHGQMTNAHKLLAENLKRRETTCQT